MDIVNIIPRVDSCSVNIAVHCILLIMIEFTTLITNSALTMWDVEEFIRCKYEITFLCDTNGLAFLFTDNHFIDSFKPGVGV